MTFTSDEWRAIRATLHANLFAEALLGHDMNGFADTDARVGEVA